MLAKNLNQNFWLIGQVEFLNQGSQDQHLNRIFKKKKCILMRKKLWGKIVPHKYQLFNFILFNFYHVTLINFVIILNKKNN